MRVRTVLVPAFCLLALTGAAPRRTTLPDLPSAAWGRNGPVPVTLVPAVDCPQPPDNVTPPGVIGCYNFKSRVIQVADTLNAEYRFFVYFHEQVHVALRDEGLPYAGAFEETYASVVARYRLGELRAALESR